MQPFSVEQVKARVLLEDIVRQHGVALHANQSGERLEGHCPLHPGDATPSFNVYVGSQRYHCFGCGASGDVIAFVQACDGCSFQEALHRLAGTNSVVPTAPFAGSRIPHPVASFPQQPESQGALLTMVQRHYHQTLLTHPTLKQDLLRARGITDAGIGCCALGYADGSWVHLVADPALLEEAQTVGLLTTKRRERMWQRLVIPECTDGSCTWMIGRTVYQPMGETRRSKYLGLSLSKPLLGMGLARKRVQEGRPVRAILVVEGALDYVIVSQWDALPLVCVALVGTHASRRQLMQLLDLQQRANGVPLLLSLDADDAGRQASAHLLAQLRQNTQAVLELAPIAGAKDLGELGTHPSGVSFLQAALEQALTQGGEPQ